MEDGMTRSGDNEGSVDLGLAALLSDSKETSSQSPTEEPVPNLIGSDASSEGTEGERELSDFEQLARAEKWQELIRKAEASLQESNDPEARIWWIRGHLGSFTMPVSFLAAPLESVCVTYTRDTLPSHLQPTLLETGKLVMRRLFEVGDREHMSSLQRALEEVGAYEPEKFSKKPSWIVAQESLISPPKIESPVPLGAREGEQVRSPKKLRAVVFFSVLIILSVTAALFFWHGGSDYFGPAAIAADEEFLRQEATLALVGPSLDRRDPVGSLSALFYSIEAQGQGTQAPTTSVKVGDVPPPPTIVPAQPSASASTALPSPTATDGQGASSVDTKAKSSGRAKEKVDTRGPVEGSEFKEKKRKGSPASGISPDASREREKLFPPLVMEERPERRAGSGVYKVIASTSVLSEPSYSGQVVDRLEPGDTVLVEARLGRWLRLKSRQGRDGFVLAEDISRREMP